MLDELCPDADAPAMNRVGLPMFITEFGLPAGSELHPLFARHCVVFGINVDCRYVYAADGTNTFALATSPMHTVEAVIALLKRTRTQFAAALAAAGKSFRWALFPRAHGKAYPEHAGDIAFYPNLRPIHKHPDDFIGGYPGPWAIAGVEWNRAWTASFAAALKTALRDNGFSRPECVCLTSENPPMDDVEGLSGYLAAGGGWVPLVLADPRADLISHGPDGRRTFREALTAFRDLDGTPADPYNPAPPGGVGLPPGRSPPNDSPVHSYYHILQLWWDRSRMQAFGHPWRSVFPGMAIVEYGSIANSRVAPIRHRPLTLMHGMNGRYITTWSGPEWYKISIENEAAAGLTHPGWMKRANWKAIYPNAHAPGSDAELRQLHLDWGHDMLNASATNAPTCVWLSVNMSSVVDADGYEPGGVASVLAPIRRRGRLPAVVMFDGAGVPPAANRDWFDDVVTETAGLMDVATP